MTQAGILICLSKYLNKLDFIKVISLNTIRFSYNPDSSLFLESGKSYCLGSEYMKVHSQENASCISKMPHTINANLICPAKLKPLLFPRAALIFIQKSENVSRETFLAWI